MLIVTALLVAPLDLIFLLVPPAALGAIVYCLINQVTNDTWSRAGYAYQAESFPTRVPGSGGWRLGRHDGRRASHWRGAVNRPDHGHHADRHLIVAVAMALGKLLTVLLRPVAAGQELEAIAT